MVPVTDTPPDIERTRTEEMARIEGRILKEERARVDNAAQADHAAEDESVLTEEERAQIKQRALVDAQELMLMVAPVPAWRRRPDRRGADRRGSRQPPHQAPARAQQAPHRLGQEPAIRAGQVPRIIRASDHCPQQSDDRANRGVGQIPRVVGQAGRTRPVVDPRSGCSDHRPTAGNSHPGLADCGPGTADGGRPGCTLALTQSC